MTQEEVREQAIQNVANVLRVTPFTAEFKVVKKPKGIRIIYEVTQKQMDAMMKKAVEGKE